MIIFDKTFMVKPSKLHFQIFEEENSYMNFESLTPMPNEAGVGKDTV